MASLPFVIAVPPNSPINSVKDLIAYIKDKDGRATYAGNTTTAIMGMEYLLKQIDGRATRVPYKALVDTMPDIAAGNLDMVLGDSTFLVGQAKAGRTKLIAVTTAQRSPSLPDLPTLQESGIADFDVTAWWAAYAPAGTPKDVIARLDGWINQISAMPETRAYLLTVATDPMPGGSDKLGALLAVEIEKWRKLMEIAKLEPQ
jgi:tripartite-type tricarboxylate transporter receptor subunit TctC